MPPCPHFDLKIVRRSKRQSAVAAAAYQSGERLFSEYDQKQKYYSHKSEIVHTEIDVYKRQFRKCLPLWSNRVVCHYKYFYAIYLHCNKQCDNL